MKKPTNFDETEVKQTSERIELGGHFAVIIDAEETTSKAGKPMLKVSFDFDKNDNQPDYFLNKYKAGDQTKWPFQGIMYLVTEDANGNTMRGFKQFCNDILASNPGFEIKWGEVSGDNWGHQFDNKKIGVVFGEEEYINMNGDKASAPKFKWTCATANVRSQNIPKVKTLPVSSLPASEASGFTPVPEGVDDEMPF